MELMEYPSIEQWEVASRRAELLAGQLAQLHAELVDLTAQVIATNAWAGEGIVSPEHWLMLRCALSPVRAREIVTIARRQGDFPELERRLHSGSISVDQLVVVAKHVPLSHARARRNRFRGGRDRFRNCAEFFRATTSLPRTSCLPRTTSSPPAP